MEKIGREEEEVDSVDSGTAIHCAKVAILLSSLKNNNYSTPKLEDEEDRTREMVLKIALLKEKQKLKNSRLSTRIILLFSLLILLIFPFVVNSIRN